MNPAKPIHSWDIFCRVVDNYGDIGVCWRLARQLAEDYQVRLWVDEIAALVHIWPSATYDQQQLLEGVDVRIWPTAFDEKIEPADAVIEAFACDLPNVYLVAMKRQAQPPHWFNVEYLSAEEWVEECHGLASIHPQLGLKKTFFFPGFTLKTGGLLREKSLLAERDLFLASPSHKADFLAKLGVDNSNAALIVSLFGYENEAISSLLAAWIESPTPVLCLVPASKILPSINAYLGQTLGLKDEFTKGSLRLKVIPFLIQTDYDRLLWTCDVNFVRGEDSFVRAQWAAKPFIWHIYPQDDDIHMLKLDAFLGHYLDNLEPALQASITQVFQQWNRGENCAQSWNLCLKNLQSWQKHSQQWCHHLNSLGDLASNMVLRCK
jgi:uncharacterized repeat protein (TIGR03837 family)